MTDTSSAADYRDYLHRYGLKNTRHRQLILQLLLASEGVLTLRIFISSCVSRHGDKFLYGLPHPGKFYAKGTDGKELSGRCAQVRLCAARIGHRHRLICLRCHRIVEVDHCPIADFEEQLADKTEFSIVGHNLEWYGYCPECRKQK